MSSVMFRFHGGLNDFLPYALRGLSFEHQFNWRASIKDMIESLGPPHCEVDLITVNGTSVDFDTIVQPGGHIDVYDLFAAAELPHGVLLRPAYKGRPRFVLDIHLGKLSSYLRMIGFDTLYRNDYGDEELAHISHTEGRILLTRDIGLLKRSLVVHGYFIRQIERKHRLIEVIHRFDLAHHVQPFQHCIKCNGIVSPVDKAAILEHLTHTTASHFDEFHRCDACGQIYWKGSHYDHMTQFLQQVIKQA